MADRFIYTRDDVLRLLELRVLRQMTRTDGQGSRFGEDFLWALLATKDG